MSFRIYLNILYAWKYKQRDLLETMFEVAV